MHTDAKKRYLIVSVLFSTVLDQPGVFLEKLGFGDKDMKKLGKNERVPVKRGVDISDLLSGTKRYIAYEGSLSRPPCSGDATWVVIVDTIRTSKL